MTPQLRGECTLNDPHLHSMHRQKEILPHDDLCGTIINAAIVIHRALGPGLLESAYQTCLEYELKSFGLQIATGVPLRVAYRTVQLNLVYRIDMIVEQTVVVELKAVPRMHPVYAAQLLSYLRLGNYPIGLLLNFHTPYMRDGIKRMIHNVR